MYPKGVNIVISFGENRMNSNFGKMSRKERDLKKEENRSIMLKKLNNEQMDWYTNKVPTMYKINYLKAMTTNSKTEQIKAKCLDCSCWLKEEIKSCSSIHCSLYYCRPYKD